MRVPAFRLVVTTPASVVSHDFFEGPTEDDLALFRPEDGVACRLRTDNGDFHVTDWSVRGGARYVTSPERPLTIKRNGGPMVMNVERLPENQWHAGPDITFLPPRASIVGDAGGWWIMFEPKQVPCVCTVAVGDTKAEGLPSFPFPRQPRFARGKYFLAENAFGAKAEGLIRLGVRGTGLSVTVALPKPGATKDIAPEQFAIEGAARPEFLTDNYVATKYNQKVGEGSTVTYEN